jgi:hypothetical protein
MAKNLLSLPKAVERAEQHAAEYAEELKAFKESQAKRPSRAVNFRGVLAAYERLSTAQLELQTVRGATLEG